MSTEYIILRKENCSDLMDLSEESGDVWHADGHIVSASSAKRAIASGKRDEGEYVAIPYRSWRPLTLKVEQTTKVTIG